MSSKMVIIATCIHSSSSKIIRMNSKMLTAPGVTNHCYISYMFPLIVNSAFIKDVLIIYPLKSIFILATVYILSFSSFMKPIVFARYAKRKTVIIFFTVVLLASLIFTLNAFGQD